MSQPFLTGKSIGKSIQGGQNIFAENQYYDCTCVQGIWQRWTQEDNSLK